MAVEHVPLWLSETFPGHCWKTLRSCDLRVSADGTAGIDLESCEFGYLVEAVHDTPGQDQRLSPGVVVVAIDDARLVGLDEDSLETVFGAHFIDGVNLLLVDREELDNLHKAFDTTQSTALVDAEGIESEQSISYIVSEHGSLIRAQIPFIRMSTENSRESLSSDLAHFSNKVSVLVEINGFEQGPPFEVVMAGAPDDVDAARSELEHLLDHHGILGDNGVVAHPVSSSTSVENRKQLRDNVAGESFEVDGLLVHSCPRRVRRKCGESVLRLTTASTCDKSGEEGGDQSRFFSGVPPRELDQASTAPKSNRSPDELQQFEYLDHTADVILHSWGSTLQEAFAQACVAFFSYLTELDTVDMVTTVEVEANGHDVLDLLYHLLDEFLFVFGTEFVVCRCVQILELDLVSLRVRAQGKGEIFDLKKHPQGTEIKAITMHQMKILTPESLTTEEGTMPRKQSSMEGGITREGFPFECYVLVDI